MKRTKKRPIVTGEIPKINALLYGTVLTIVGFWLLLAYTNKLTALVGLVGFIFYIVVYGVAKRKTLNSTLIGTISGATPPVAGYVAVTNTIDVAAVLLFLVLVFWQMPHFYAIAIFRSKEYAAAHLPTMPQIKGIAHTKKLMLLYGILFVLATQMLAVTGYMGIWYSILMFIAAINWLRVIADQNITDENAWALRVFKVSLYTLLSFSVLISLRIVFA
jgi:protoheme IX farnesyltransferase